jgi:L-lactate dehydrogenase complex protein LldE
MSSHQTSSLHATSLQQRPETVYLFGTCLVDMADPMAGLAAIRLIQSQGVRVVFPQGQSCCGQPAYNSGKRADALAVARQTLHQFPQPWPVVVPSGSCGGMVARHFPDLFAGEPDHAEACAFAARVVELSQFLLHTLDFQPDDKGAPITITWHSSCHALREMGVEDEPKTLLRRLSNVTLIELKRERECCGFGGTFSVRQPEISAVMVADKAADISATGAEQVLSGDCGCLLNIGGHLKASGSQVGTQHLASFLWDRVTGGKGA